MSTIITIKVLTKDLRFRSIVEEAINKDHIIYIPEWNMQAVRIKTDDPITKEEIINAIGEYMEYIDTIELTDTSNHKMEFSKDVDSPFISADKLV